MGSTDTSNQRNGELFSQIVEKIIAQQESVIGPIAIERAAEINGLKIDWSSHNVEVSGNESKVIDELVESYKELFGPISVEVSRDAVSSLVQSLPESKRPKSLA